MEIVRGCGIRVMGAMRAGEDGKCGGWWGRWAMSLAAAAPSPIPGTCHRSHRLPGAAVRHAGRVRAGGAERTAHSRPGVTPRTARSCRGAAGLPELVHPGGVPLPGRRLCLCLRLVRRDHGSGIADASGARRRSALARQQRRGGASGAPFPPTRASAQPPRIWVTCRAGSVGVHDAETKGRRRVLELRPPRRQGDHYLSRGRLSAKIGTLVSVFKEVINTCGHAVPSSNGMRRARNTVMSTHP